MAGWLLAAGGAEGKDGTARTDAGDCGVKDRIDDARRGCDGAGSDAVASGWAERFWKRMLLGSVTGASKTLRDALLNPTAVVVAFAAAVVVADVAVAVAAVVVVDLEPAARGGCPARAGRTGEPTGICC